MNTFHVFLYYVLPLILILGVLILFHELGHFIVAKLFNVKVLRFSLGLGPKLFGKKFGETEYAISMIPFGGYVKMLGEDLDEEEPIPQWEEHRAFNNQPILKRMAIVAAGPIFNLLLAFFIFVFFYAIVGEKVLAPEVGKVEKGSPAWLAGVEPGDFILAIDDIPVRRWEDIKKIVRKKGSVPIKLRVKKGDDIYLIQVTPRPGKVKNIFGEEVQTVIIGIVASGKKRILKFSFLGAVKEAFNKSCEITRLTCITLVKLVKRVVPMKTLGGPILIGQITGKIAQQDWRYLFPFTAVISINLGILNLLPVPILDGGLILLLFIEIILRRPLDRKVQETAHKVGLILLIGLMAIVMYNDIMRVLTK